MPCRPARHVVAAALALACQGVLAQQMGTAAPAVTVQQVQQLAPQLVPFAGSQENFNNLINGLAQGTQIRLVTVLPDGSSQIVTFTPSGTLTPVEIAQVLEAARQQLIGLGIATPTAEQLAIALVGGRVPTALGGTQVASVVPSAPAQASSAAAGATALPAGTNTVSVQTVPTPPATTPATTATTIGNTSDSPIPAGATSRTPSPGSVSNSPVPGAPTPAPSTPSSMRR